MEWKRMIFHNEDLGDFYECSDDGKIRKTKTKDLVSQNVNKKGYCYATLYLNKKSQPIRVHIAIAETFLGEKPFEKAQVNHKDGNKTNNHFSNLEWVSNRENTVHAIENNMINFKTAPIICVEIGRWFSSVKAAGEFIKPLTPEAGRKNISRALKNGTTAYKLHWRYATDEENEEQKKMETA